MAEIDYYMEAQNIIQFETAMLFCGLDAVCAPTVIEDYVQDKVIVSNWVAITPLDKMPIWMYPNYVVWQLMPT